MAEEKDKNWIGISNRKELIKVFKDYLSIRLPMRASKENWPINNQTNLSMIVIYNIIDKKFLYFDQDYVSQTDKLEKLFTDDQFKIGIRICMEIELGGLSRLILYQEKSGIKINELLKREKIKI